VPLTTVVETTHVVDPERAGGTLLYVPKYVTPDSPELERSSREIRREYLGHVARMFPSFDPADVLHAQVARARVAEPVHVLGGRRPEPEDAFVAPGLAAVSSAGVYPDLVNGQAVLGVAERLAEGLQARVGAAAAEARAA
jgi:protoporphyrinogen oxidase